MSRKKHQKSRKTRVSIIFSLKTPSKRSFEGVLREITCFVGVLREKVAFLPISVDFRPKTPCDDFRLKTPSKGSFLTLLKGF
jgi:hypothetical protein